jgi:hypothetical protein
LLPTPSTILQRNCMCYIPMVTARCVQGGEAGGEGLLGTAEVVGSCEMGQDEVFLLCLVHMFACMHALPCARGRGLMGLYPGPARWLS